MSMAERSAQPIEIGGPVRRVAVLTTRRDPCACYLARKLSSTGVEILLVSQNALKVEPDSWAYFRRLYRRRGLMVFADNVLLWLVKATVRALRPSSGEASPAPPPLRDDPEIAQEDWLTYVETDSINRGPGHERLREFSPDLILLAGAPIVSRRTIGIAGLACINPHCGITPDFAGSSPVDWAIYERRFDDIGYTIHLVVPRVDSGAVLHQERVEWDPSRPNNHLWAILARRMYDRMAEIAGDLIAGKRLPAEPQAPTRVLPPAGLFIRTLAEWRRTRYAKTFRRGSSPPGR
jgi:hypothetical protein